MKEEQEKALIIISSIEKKISELEASIEEYKEDMLYVKGTSAKRTQIKIDMMIDFARYLACVVEDMERKFDVGWIQTGITQQSFEQAHMPGVKFTNTTRKMERIDGKVRYDVKITSTSMLLMQPPKDSGILGLN
mgnify:CR=1 FL=1